jgi:hypothetical protein
LALTSALTNLALAPDCAHEHLHYRAHGRSPKVSMAAFTMVFMIPLTISFTGVFTILFIPVFTSLFMKVFMEVFMIVFMKNHPVS